LEEDHSLQQEQHELGAITSKGSGTHKVQDQRPENEETRGLLKGEAQKQRSKKAEGIRG
jgi:hypothetical protein